MSVRGSCPITGHMRFTLVLSVECFRVGRETVNMFVEPWLLSNITGPYRQNTPNKCWYYVALNKEDSSYDIWENRFKKPQTSTFLLR